MALSSYTDVQAAVAAWLHRDDLTASVPDFIALAESRIARDLRLRRQITSTDLVVTAGTPTVALPADWLELRALRLLVPDTALGYLSGVQFVAHYLSTDTGAPQHYTIEGGNLRLGPTPDASGTLAATYFARLPALSDSTSTTWLLTEHPGLYLFGALAEAAPFLGQADNRVALWDTKYRSAVHEAQRADQAAASSGSTLRVRAR